MTSKKPSKPQAKLRTRQKLGKPDELVYRGKPASSVVDAATEIIPSVHGKSIPEIAVILNKANADLDKANTHLDTRFKIHCILCAEVTTRLEKSDGEREGKARERDQLMKLLNVDTANKFKMYAKIGGDGRYQFKPKYAGLVAADNYSTRYQIAFLKEEQLEEALDAEKLPKVGATRAQVTKVRNEYAPIKKKKPKPKDEAVADHQEPEAEPPAELTEVWTPLTLSQTKRTQLDKLLDPIQALHAAIRVVRPAAEAIRDFDRNLRLDIWQEVDKVVKNMLGLILDKAKHDRARDELHFVLGTPLSKVAQKLAAHKCPVTLAAIVAKAKAKKSLFPTIDDQKVPPAVAEKICTEVFAKLDAELAG